MTYATAKNSRNPFFIRSSIPSRVYSPVNEPVLERRNPFFIRSSIPSKPGILHAYRNPKSQSLLHQVIYSVVEGGRIVHETHPVAIPSSSGHLFRRGGLCCWIFIEASQSLLHQVIYSVSRTRNATNSG